jgi:diacylglycerol kinase family enzyme
MVPALTSALTDRSQKIAMRVLVLLNQAAGTLVNSSTGDEPQLIERSFRESGVEARVENVDGSRLAEVTRRAIESGDIDAVIAGGGDGTLNTIAAQLAGSNVAFGVLPLGTFNHFAKEMGVPLNLDEAVPALARAQVNDLDIGEVNGRIFLNFSAIGIHPLIVKHRDAQQQVLGRRKKFAMFMAVFSVLKRMRLMRVRLRWNDGFVRRLTPSVTVCNNPYQMEVFGVENVSYQSRDVLNVYMARSTGWFGIVWLLIRAAFKRLENAREFEVLTLPEFDVETGSRHVRVSIDGEVTDLKSPLNYRVRKRGLKVLVPIKQ